MGEIAMGEILGYERNIPGLSKARLVFSRFLDLRGNLGMLKENRLEKPFLSWKEFKSIPNMINKKSSEENVA